MSLLLAALLVSTDPAAAEQQAPAAALAAKPAKEKKICKTDTNESSSRLRRRVCLTQTEWEQKEAGKSAGDLKTMGAR